MSLTVPLAGEFPVLERERVAYLDSAATSQTPRAVIEAMDRYYLEARATVHRSTYALAAEATEMFEGARNAHRRVHRLDRRRDDLHPQRDRRRSTWLRRRGGAPTSSPWRRGDQHADGTPLQHCAVADAGR